MFCAYLAQRSTYKECIAPPIYSVVRSRTAENIRYVTLSKTVLDKILAFAQCMFLFPVFHFVL